jgi:hypothetical protein
MQVIRGVYDGKTIRPLPTETLPEVEGEIPVEIVFLTDGLPEEELLRQRLDAAMRLISARDAMPPLDIPLQELIEDGRYR